MALSYERKIKIILEKKDEICKLSNEVLELLTKLTPPPGNFELNDEENLLARTKLNQMIKDMSIIAGFCDKSSQKYVAVYADIISRIGAGRINSKIQRVDRIILDKLCVMANTLMVDFNKKPWKFTEFEVGIRNLLKAKTKAHK